MKESGYDRNFRKKVIEEGLRGFEKAVEESKKGCKSFVRSKEEILEAYSRKKGKNNGTTGMVKLTPQYFSFQPLRTQNWQRELQKQKQQTDSGEKVGSKL